MWKKIKAALGNEGKKLKEMTSFREKREYIWEYYKLHITGGLFLIFMIGSIVNTVWINPPKRSFVHIAFYGDYVTDEQSAAFSDVLTRELVVDKEREKVYLTDFFVDQEDPQVSMAVSQKFVAMVAANELDLLVTDEESTRQLNEQGYFTNLYTIFTQSELAPYEHLLATAPDVETGQIEAYGINIEGNSFLSAFGLPTENNVISVLVGTGRAAKVKDTILYILK